MADFKAICRKYDVENSITSRIKDSIHHVSVSLNIKDLSRFNEFSREIVDNALFQASPIIRAYIDEDSLNLSIKFTGSDFVRNATIVIQVPVKKAEFFPSESTDYCSVDKVASNKVYYNIIATDNKVTHLIGVKCSLKTTSTSNGKDQISPEKSYIRPSNKTAGNDTIVESTGQNKSAGRSLDSVTNIQSEKLKVQPPAMFDIVKYITHPISLAAYLGALITYFLVSKNINDRKKLKIHPNAYKETAERLKLDLALVPERERAKLILKILNNRIYSQLIFAITIIIGGLLIAFLFFGQHQQSSNVKTDLRDSSEKSN